MFLTWDYKGIDVLIELRSRSTFGVNVTKWSKGLEVTADGRGIVSHARLVLLRRLADRTGRPLVHDQVRVIADLAAAIADGAEMVRDFRVMGD
jgi:hypothetical protein